MLEYQRFYLSTYDNRYYISSWSYACISYSVGFAHGFRSVFKINAIHALLFFVAFSASLENNPVQTIPKYLVHVRPAMRTFQPYRALTFRRFPSPKTAFAFVSVCVCRIHPCSVIRVRCVPSPIVRGPLMACAMLIPTTPVEVNAIGAYTTPTPSPHPAEIPTPSVPSAEPFTLRLSRYTRAGYDTNSSTGIEHNTHCFRCQNGRRHKHSPHLNPHDTHGSNSPHIPSLPHFPISRAYDKSAHQLVTDTPPLAPRFDLRRTSLRLRQ